MEVEKIDNVTLKFKDGDNVTIHENEIESLEVYGINLNLVWNKGATVFAHTCYDFQIIFQEDLLAEAQNRKTGKRHMARLSDKLLIEKVMELIVKFNNDNYMNIIVVDVGEDAIAGKGRIEDGRFIYRCLPEVICSDN